jgi:hypothetical protein
MHERRLEARVQTLLEAVDIKPPERIRPYDLQKLISSGGIDGMQNECLRHFQDDHWYT